MASSVSSTETLESGTALPPLSRRRRQLLVAGVALAAALAAFVSVRADTPVPPSGRYVETFIDAWNARDSQALSSMTCDYIPAFVSASTIETYLELYPADRPVVADHSVIGTEPATVYGRTGEQVSVSYELGTRHTRLEGNVFVRVRNDGDMCIGDFAAW
jgi:hypothetical protein